MTHEQAKPGMPRECRTAIAMFLLMREMESGKRYTSKDVAERFGVHVRSAQRWMDMLARHTPIEYQRRSWGYPAGFQR